MKRLMTLPVIFLIAIGSLKLLSSFYPVYAKPEDKGFNIREIVYGIDTKEVHGGLTYKLITIDQDGDITHHIAFSHSPLDALVDLGYEVSNKYKVISTSPIYTLYNRSFIKMMSSYVSLEEILTEIEYSTITKGQTLCERLSSQVLEQEGVLGVMTTTVQKSYIGNELIAEEIINEEVNEEPRPEIIIIEGPNDEPNVINQPNTYDCDYWHSYIDNSVNATAEEKRWLKEVMFCESGCNAASNKGYYKGLFQWDPCFWYKQYPEDNIFDGRAQIEHTLFKIRAGARTMWPACNRKYIREFGE